MKSTIKRSLSVAALTTLSSTLLVSTLHAAPLNESVVFKKGDSGYNTFRIPAITTAANGNLLAFAEGRKNGGGDSGDIDLVLRRSTDGGATWGALQVVGNDGANTFGNPVPVLDSSTGRLFLITTHNNGNDSLSEIVAGTSVADRTIWVQQSDDNGATWTAAKEVSSTAKDPTWSWISTGPVHGFQLTRGASAGRLVIPSAYIKSGSSGAYEMYSDDHGVTWKHGSAVTSSGSTSFNESTEVELVDGRVQMNARNSAGTTRSRSIAYSSDGGLTFGPKSQAAALIDPVVQGALLRFSAIDNGGSENRILFSNPADPSNRVNMTVRSSLDETATWNAGKRIWRGPSAYSDLVAYGSGKAGVLFEKGVSSAYETITFSNWSNGWLDDPTVARYDLNEKLSGVASTSTNAILDSRGYGLHGTVTGTPTYVAGTTKFGGDGKAIHFNGGSDGIFVPDTVNGPEDFTAGESFTLETVIRTTAHGSGGANASGPLISKDVGSGEPSYWLRVEDGKVRFLVSDTSASSIVTSSISVNDGQWHHIAAMRDFAKDELRLYVDYALVGTVTDTTTGDFGNDNPLALGSFNNTTAGLKHFVGDMEFAAVRLGVTSIPEPTTAALAVAGGLACVRRRR